MQSERMRSDQDDPIRNEGWEREIFIDQDTNQSNHTSGSKHNKKIKKFATKLRLVEFAVAIGVLIISYIISLSPVYERPIPAIAVPINATYTVYVRDPSHDFKQGGGALFVGQPSLMVIVMLPLIHIFINYIFPRCKLSRRVANDTRDFALGLIQSVSISGIFTQLLKVRVGRLRPSFYDMCKWNYNETWDGKTNLCTDPVWDRQARMSFPSGHAANSWSIMFFLTLYLLGRSQLVTGRDKRFRTGLWKSLQLFGSFLPSVFACWMSLLRTQNNWHYSSDIFAGIILGVMGAIFGYGFNYGSIFSRKYAGMPRSNIDPELENQLPTHHRTDMVSQTSTGTHHEDIRQRANPETSNLKPHQ